MNYYCSAKFTELQVHVQGRLLYNCCKAYPERVDLDWLEGNPGKLFYTDTMLEDRDLMLKNRSCSSCHYGCFQYEEKGLPSTRQYGKYDQTYINDKFSPLKILSIILSTDCNLTCMYCSSEFSSAWQRDIENNGEYIVNKVPVKQNSNWATLWSKMKQKSRGTDTRFFKQLLNEIKLSKGLDKIKIMGGEPLLNNQLDQILELKQLNGKEITINTGLGVSDKRLQQLLKKTKGKNIVFNLSAEATGALFELIRHGVSWKDFDRRVQMIEKNGHKIVFISTISNLSVLGFKDFYQKYAEKHKVEINLLTNTNYMMPHVLDATSKKNFIESIQDKSNLPEFLEISKMIEKEPSSEDRIGAGQYLEQFSSRRSVDLGFLPTTFLKWCGINS